MNAMKSQHDIRVYLVNLRHQRRQRKRTSVKLPRMALTAARRLHVLSKTAGRCHICGGKSRLRSGTLITYLRRAAAAFIKQIIIFPRIRFATTTHGHS